MSPRHGATWALAFDGPTARLPVPTDPGSYRAEAEATNGAGLTAPTVALEWTVDAAQDVGATADADLAPDAGGRDATTGLGDAAPNPARRSTVGCSVTPW